MGRAPRLHASASARLWPGPALRPTAAACRSGAGRGGCRGSCPTSIFRPFIEGDEHGGQVGIRMAPHVAHERTMRDHDASGPHRDGKDEVKRIVG